MDYDEREDEWNPLETNQSTIEDILDHLSFHTVKSNIEDQIEGELESTRDFLGILMSKVNTIMESLSDSQMRRQISDEYATFCTDLSAMIIYKYGLGCSLLSDYDTSDDVLECLYRFFIQNHYLYAKNFFCNYIREHKDAIVDALGLTVEAGDITTMANRKKISDDAIIMIISNMDSVVDFIMYSASVTAEEFIDTIDDGDVITNDLREFYETYQVTGNFVSQYLEEVASDSCSDRALEIRNDIRVTLYMDR